jgi:hypothetical protein
MDVTTFLEPEIDLERLTAILDGLGHEGRVHTTRTWTGRQQGALFEAAKGYRSAELDFLVPTGTTPLEEVIHEGINSLPMFRRFQKRFTNVTTSGGEPSIAGFNRQIWEWFSGPGYFTAREGKDEHAGEIAIDYETLPTAKVASWPPIRPNAGFGPGIVYGRLTDYVRPISNHVSIAAAYRSGKFLNWFALVRRDPS